jgi:hypothetical protein
LLLLLLLLRAGPVGGTLSILLTIDRQICHSFTFVGRDFMCRIGDGNPEVLRIEPSGQHRETIVGASGGRE